jgi:putative ABC transport system substrate-binding protein
MKRRAVLASVGATVSLPSIVRAQSTGRVWRIGPILPIPATDPTYINVLEGLRTLGFVEGKNLVMDPRGAGLLPDQMPGVARRLADDKVDLLLAGGGPAIRAAQSASSTIPIVGSADDMVREGLVGSLANRSGSTTGLSFLATELDAKRQEILMELLPDARRMAALTDSNPYKADEAVAVHDVTRQKGIELVLLRIDKAEDIEPALDSAKAHGVQALNILASPRLFALHRQIFAKTTALRLPTIYQWPEGAKEGALLAYGPSFVDTFRQWGRMAGKVLRGAKPADLPVEQPTTFKLAINLKLAREFGVTVPLALLQRADEVVE